MNIPAFDLQRQAQELKPELMAALEAVIDSCAFSLGPQVASFEKAFAELCGVREAVALNSGTSALHLALVAAGVGPGDEVITTSWTFIATAWACSYVGATPVFADVDDETLNLDPTLVEARITPRTRAVIPVHLYGQMADMDAFEALCRRHDLVLIEDAAQAHGASLRGRRTGGFGRAACFSFYPSKNLGACGEGGAVTCDDPAFAARIRTLRNHAQSTKYFHDEVGFNHRMTGFQGACLNVKLRRFAAWNARRREVAARYLEGLAGTPGLRLPVEAPGTVHVYHQFTCRHPQRDAVRAGLEARGIGTTVYYPQPVHLQPAYAGLGYAPGSLPVCERAAKEVFSLPMFPELTDDEVAQVITAVREVIDEL